MCTDLPQKAGKKGYLTGQKPLLLTRIAIWVRENGVADEDGEPHMIVFAGWLIRLIFHWSLRWTWHARQDSGDNLRQIKYW